MQQQQLATTTTKTPLTPASAPAVTPLAEPTTTLAPIPAAAPGAGPAPAAAASQVFGHLTDGPATTKPAVAATTGGPAAVQGPPMPTVADYNGTMDKGLDALIAGNLKTRTELDKEKATGAANSDTTAKGLDGSRQSLLDQLNLRSGVYDEQMKGLQAKLGNTLPKNFTPEQKAESAQLAELTKEKSKYGDQQTALQRWHDRGQINSIDEQLKNPSLDPKAKTALLAQKKQLATGLLSTVKMYEQFSGPWANDRYGHGAGPKDTMTAAGCGPTGLADLMNFADQEDPEGHHAQHDPDYYDPRRMAAYATNHGRVVGSGTDGTQMMHDLNGSFPGVKGNTVHDLAGAKDQLADGLPVLFVGHDASGKGAQGQKTKSYDGHFMVLNGVDDAGQNFQVKDGGRGEHPGQAFTKIHTMSAADLNQQHVYANDFWTVGRK